MPKPAQRMLTTLVVMVLAIAGAIFITGGANSLAQALAQPASETQTETTVVETSTTSVDDVYTGNTGSFHFYNFDVASSNDPNVIFNFGPSPVKDGMTAEQYSQDLEQRSSEDPALLAAVTGYTDARIGTQFMGEFYSSAGRDWAKALNNAKDTWMKDPTAFAKAHSTYWQFIHAAATPQLDNNSRTIQDMMFMNPFTGTDSPDIIVLRTDQNQGPWLVYEINIKGNIFEVAFRCPCGYQPADIQRTMGITPQEKPSTQISGSTTSSTPPTPTPSEDNPYDKGIENSSNSGKNRNPGPGPDTNNGVGADMGAADSSLNSGSGSYQDYSNNQQNISDANSNAEHQEQTGNAPSSEPPAPSDGGNTTIDNPANSGNDYGNIDTPPAQDIPDDPLVNGVQGQADWSW